MDKSIYDKYLYSLRFDDLLSLWLWAIKWYPELCYALDATIHAALFLTA